VDQFETKKSTLRIAQTTNLTYTVSMTIQTGVIANTCEKVGGGEYELYYKEKSMSSISLYGSRQSFIEFSTTHFVHDAQEFEEMKKDFAVKRSNDVIPICDWKFRILPYT
jgi:hypothetical protein